MVEGGIGQQAGQEKVLELMYACASSLQGYLQEQEIGYNPPVLNHSQVKYSASHNGMIHYTWYSFFLMAG